MSDVVIRAEGLGKKYLIGHETERERYVALRDVIGRTAKGLLRSARDMMRGHQLVAGDEVEEIWALKDVSFEIRRGEVVGIIGRNGAGKSTLLKILSRITEPSAGRVEIRGRVASLLEVGTGFHPELTGRENIYLNGAILGMTRAEIRRKFDEIVDFAGVEKFLDTPVKRYSSGMYVRLAFAVAAHLEPEILVVDEVLAVGDAEFQRKCLGKMGEVARGGRTVLFVSHNMSALETLCSRAIHLQDARITFQGPVNVAIDRYLHSTEHISGEPLSTRADRRGDGRLRFTLVQIGGEEHQQVQMGDAATITLHYNAIARLDRFNITIHFQNDSGQTVLRLSTVETYCPLSCEAGPGSVACRIEMLPLLPGTYRLLIAASIPPAYQHLDYVENSCTFRVVAKDIYGTGKVPKLGFVFAKCNWLETPSTIGRAARLGRS